MDAPWGVGGGGGVGGIDPNTHRTISGRCHEDTSRSWLEDYPRYSVMVDPLSNVLFNPVLHDWCNKGPWYVLSCLWDDAYKITLAANRK